jgi:membrane protein DedA with SNARE-associated domain
VFGWIAQLIEKTGYVGVALLMFLENVFPPIPSELIMPMAGFTAARGDLKFIGIVAAGTAGSLAGALLWYSVGTLVTEQRLKSWAEKHGRWLTLKPEDVDKASTWFGKHCGAAVFFGRLVPTVRTLISVPAGIFAMSRRKFLMLTLLGSGVWSTALTAAGYLLEDRYEQVGRYLNPVATGIVAIIVVVYVYRLVTWRKGERRSSP